jgi:hypothetical protein
MKAIKVILGLSIILLHFSCNNSDDDANTLPAMSSGDAKMSARIDIATDDVSKIVEDQLTTSDGISGRTTAVATPFLPECATVTRVPEYGTTLTPGVLITKTIDFGTEGCALPNGNVLKGIIEISFLYQPDATSHTINYTFENFYHNSIKFDGTKTFTRTMGTSAANAENHPIVTMNMDLTATFPNNTVVTRVGTRVREITQGYETPEWLDNVYQISGNWTSTFPNNVTQINTITTPLTIKLNCPNIVSGVITFVRNSNTSYLNYGTGDCDNAAVFTIFGVTYPIVLGN